MTVSGRQIRAARALLNMKQEELADYAGLTPQAIHRIEDGAVQPREGTMADIVQAFSNRGLEFTENSGLRLKPHNIEVYEGQERYEQFYDFIYEHLKETGGNACVAGSSGRLFSKYRKNPDIHRTRMMELKKARRDFLVRILIEEDDDYMPNSGFAEYRLQKKEQFPPTSFYVFGTCVALVTFDNIPPPLVILIKSPLFAEAYRRFFDIAWSLASIPPAPRSKRP